MLYAISKIKDVLFIYYSFYVLHNIQKFKKKKIVAFISPISEILSKVFSTMQPGAENLVVSRSSCNTLLTDLYTNTVLL